MDGAPGTASPVQTMPRPSPPPPEGPDTNDLLALRTERLKLLYASAPVVLGATVLCAMALAVVEWALVPPAPLLAWLAYMLVLALGRFMLARAYKRSAPGLRETPRWERRFLTGVGLTSVGWGSAAFLLFPESSVPHQIFLIFILGGMTAGAVTTLSAKFGAFLCFAVPTMTPAAVRLLSADIPLASTMGWLTVIFTLALAYVTLRVQATIVRSLELRLQNQALLNQLRLQTARIEQAEHARVASDRRYQFFVDQATDIIYRTDPAGRFTFVNVAAACIMRYAETEMIGRHFLEFIRPDYRQAVQRFYGRQFVRKIPSTYFEFPALTKDRGTVWLGQNVQLLADGGRVFGFQAVVRDITERKQAELALAASEKRLKTILETEPQCVKVLTEHSVLRNMNPAGLKMVEVDRLEDLLGRSVLPIVAPAHRDAFADFVRRVHAGQPGVMQFEIIGLKGGHRWVETHAVPLHDDLNGAIEVLAVTRDVTERKRAEEALHCALQSREQLARDLHDNLIQSIYAIGFTLEECQELLTGAPENATRKLDQVVDELNRLIREVRGYLAAPPEDSEHLSASDLITSVQRLGSLMEQEDGTRFVLALDPAAAGALSAVQRAQFLYVTKEAMSNSLRHSKASTVRVSLDCAQRGVRLEIRDDGVGFEIPGMRNGKGGLRNIRLRARKIGANLDISSRPMGGTLISMELPGNT